MNHFLNHYRHKHGGQTSGFTLAAVRALLNYDFPGNIRELQNLIERAVIMADADGLIDVHHLFTSGETLKADVMTLRLQGSSGTLNFAAPAPAPAGAAINTPTAPVTLAPQSLEKTERDTLARAIAASKGNLSAAARLLDTTRAKLAFRAKKHGLV